MRPPNIIQIIASARPELRKSECKVADFVLGAPQEVIHMRIVDLAQEAHVSEPTVVRFCRAIGCNSFQAFKVTLAQHVANNPRFEQFSLSAHDSAREYGAKVFDTVMDTLSRVRERLDTAVIEQAVAALAQARRVEFYGFGASSAVASDAQHKFFRLQIASAAYADPHLQAMSALSLGPEDVVVAISQSGRTHALINAMSLARINGARVISLTPAGTPVARHSDIAITIDVEEETDRYTPLPSRIAHMTMMDVLAVGVVHLKGNSVDQHLQQLNSMLEQLRS